MTTSRIYLSAVLDELGTAQSIAVHLLEALNFEVITHDCRSGSNDHRIAITEKIDSCDFLVQLVGSSLGPCLPERDPKYRCVSYAQFEFYHARACGKKTVLIFTQDGCQTDQPLDSLDLPAGDHPDPRAVQRACQINQAKYRESLTNSEHLYYQASSHDEILALLVRLETPLQKLRQEAMEWRDEARALLAELGNKQDRHEERILSELSDIKQQINTLADSTEAIHTTLVAEMTETRMLVESAPESGQDTENQIFVAWSLPASVPGASSGPTQSELMGRMKLWAGEQQGRIIEETQDWGLHSFGSAASALAFVRQCVSWPLESWPTGAPVQSPKVAMHLGRVSFEAIDKTGTPNGPHRLIRADTVCRTEVLALLKMAHPGQVLVFQTVHRLSQSADLGVRWHNHGPYQSQTQSEPMEIFEALFIGNQSPQSPIAHGELGPVRGANATDLADWRPVPGAPMPGKPNWEIVEKLGEGGFGEAWLIHQPKSKERLVLKFCFNRDKLSSLVKEADFLNKFKQGSAVQPFIVQLMGTNLEKPPYYIALEHYPLGSIVDYEKTIGGLQNLTQVQRLQVCLSLAKALSTLHGSGACHRDIKPSNILLKKDAKGQLSVVLADFGTGATAGEKANPGQSKTMAGTLIYEAPEILEGGEPTTLSDIYSFGVTVFQILALDLRMPMAPGWEQHILDPNLRNLIGLCVLRNPRNRIQDIGPVLSRLSALIGADSSHGSFDSYSGKNYSTFSIGNAVVVSIKFLAYLLTPISYLLKSILGHKIARRLCYLGVAAAGIWLSLLAWDSMSDSKLYKVFAELVAQPGLPPGLAPLPKSKTPVREDSAVVTVPTPVPQVIPVMEEVRTQPKPITTPSISPNIRPGNTPTVSALDRIRNEPAPQFQYHGLEANHLTAGRVSAPNLNQPGSNPIEEERLRQVHESNLAAQRAPIVNAQRALQAARRAADAGQPVPLTYGRVTLIPGYPRAGQTLTVAYDSAGTELATTTALYLQYGVNQWQVVSETRIAMTRQRNGTWYCQIKVPESIQEVNFLFTTQKSGDDGYWESNNRNGWRIPIFASSPTVRRN